MQHLGQACHQTVLVAVHRELLGKDVEHWKGQPDGGAEHGDEADFGCFSHGPHLLLKLEIDERAVSARRHPHQREEKQYQQPHHTR